MRTETKGLLISLAISAACVLAFVLAGCSPRAIPDSRPVPRVKAWIGITGMSMYPTVPNTALVEVEFGVPFEELGEGWCVIYWDYKRGTNALTHHRLNANQGGNWIAKGDNPETNPVVDASWVTRDNFIGVTARAGEKPRWATILTAPNP